ncbi:putative HLH DNA binding domain protein [Aspergillus udagawae]|uniref:HLH DNA binding domain protein n=1 Tax=Aspergillus udagawae TaxID=91492 RepID=A0ABQ1AFA6_9EURO|nr:putative HLH DNA binding domain protein [Aspergillus udagawae]GFG10455.1 putative HLH DNA binding domain protein [Aspergillus udagawae]
MATYPDMLPGPQDDNESIDAFQLRSMLPETIPPDSTSSMVLNPEDICPEEISGPLQNVKFPNYIGEFRETTGSSDVPPSEVECKTQLWPPTRCAQLSDPASSDKSTSDTTAPRTSTDSLSDIANTKHKAHNKVQQRPSPKTISQEDFSLISSMLSPSPSSTPPPKKSRTSSADSPTINGRKAAKRASHNVIEKRYRTNMNAKFTTLEKVITSCGNKQKVSNSRPCSMKKCEILTNAIKCIQNLEDRNAALCEDVAFLREQHHLLGAI